MNDKPANANAPGKNQAAVEMGRRGGKKGGVARAKNMTPEARASSARLAARWRWAKPPSKLVSQPEPLALEGEVLPPSPFAKHRGVMTLGGLPVEVYVLDTGDRVISMRGAVKVLTGTDGGILRDYIGVKALKDFVNSELVAEESADFLLLD